MAEQVLRCPKCGGEIRHTSAFCEHCGTPVKITVATVKEDTSSKETLDPEKEKAKEEYFKKRAAIASASVDKKTSKEGLSVDVNKYFMKFALIGGFLLGMNFVTFGKTFFHGAVTKTNVLYFLLAGLLLTIILVPIFNKIADNENRRTIRRWLRSIGSFNVFACGGPLFICIVIIVESFMEVNIPMNYETFHSLLILACFAICTLIAFWRYLSIRVNKSLSDICMQLHFDSYTMMAFMAFAIVVYIFAVYV